MAIHCLYWPGFVGPTWSVLKSLFLFEMPVLFFVAGASNGLGRSRGWLPFLRSRLSRVLIPYWAYAAVCLALEMGKASSFLGLSRPMVLGWLVPYSMPLSTIPPLAWHLWFIPVYLVVMTLFPALRAVHERTPAWARFVPLLVLAGAIVGLDHLGGWAFSRNLVFYSFWVALGLFYPRFKTHPWHHSTILATSLAAFGAVTALVLSGAYGADFQWNKFPPNFAFLLLGIGHLGLLTLLRLPLLALARQPLVSRLIAPYREYGFTIYLFHPLIFVALRLVLDIRPGLLRLAQDHSLAAVALLLPAVVVLAPLAAFPCAALERTRTQKGGNSGSPDAQVRSDRHVLPQPASRELTSRPPG
jgi:surface polysaccharide O-acyltransferase-like enzyme